MQKAIFLTLPKMKKDILINNKCFWKHNKRLM